MFREKTTILFILLLILLTSGCGLFRPKPTDLCHYEMDVNELESVEEFDRATFFEIAIEVAKDKNLPQAMFYDVDKGVVTFGKEKLTHIPGIPMVVYIVLKKEGGSEKICFNAFPYEDRSLLPNKVNEIMEDYKNAVRDQYIQNRDALKNLYKRYQGK